MQTEVRVSNINGIIKAPASKSCMQRALALALLARGRSVINNPSFCDDSLSAMSMAEDLGALVEREDGSVAVTGNGIPSPVKNVINCGESGLAARLFIPVSALCDQEISIQGRGTLLSREMKHFSEPLKELGVEFDSPSGFLPVRVKGPLQGGRVSIDGSMSSQFLSGLLIALPLTQSESSIEVDRLNSKPYVDLTVEMMKMAGVQVINNGYRMFFIKAGQKYHPFSYTVEGDWSGASLFMVLGAIRGKITITGLDIDSYQADRKIINLLSDIGATVKVSRKAITISSSGLRPFRFDASQAPDLVPSMVVLALACEGRSEISNISRLRMKESDRIVSLYGMVRSLGGKVTEESDSLIIEGGNALRGGVVESFNDHRIAMAAAAASILCNDNVIIRGTECISKSYPDFMDHLARAGGRITNKS